MLTVTGVLTFLAVIMAMMWYCPLVIRRRVKPAPATWIIATFAMNLSVASYHAIGRTILENVTLYAATFEITIVFVVLMIVLIRSGELRLAFDRVQKFCLAVMGVAMFYWSANKDQSDITFWTTQVLLVVSYLATISRAIQKKSAFDSIGNWGFIFLSSVVGSIPAIVMMSPYGLANSARAVLSSGITVGVLIYFDRKNGWTRWSDEFNSLLVFYRIH